MTGAWYCVDPTWTSDDTYPYASVREFLVMCKRVFDGIPRLQRVDDRMVDCDDRRRTVLVWRADATQTPVEPAGGVR